MTGGGETKRQVGCPDARPAARRPQSVHPAAGHTGPRARATRHSRQLRGNGILLLRLRRHPGPELLTSDHTSRVADSRNQNRTHDKETWTELTVPRGRLIEWRASVRFGTTPLGLSERPSVREPLMPDSAVSSRTCTCPAPFSSAELRRRTGERVAGEDWTTWKTPPGPGDAGRPRRPRTRAAALSQPAFSSAGYSCHRVVSSGGLKGGGEPLAHPGHSVLGGRHALSRCAQI